MNENISAGYKDTLQTIDRINTVSQKVQIRQIK